MLCSRVEWDVCETSPIMYAVDSVIYSQEEQPGEQ